MDWRQLGMTSDRLLTRALAIKENTMGPDHPSVAHSLNNLACLAAQAGDFEAAEPLARRALLVTDPCIDHIRRVIQKRIGRG
jgi:hypothetical protein